MNIIEKVNMILKKAGISKVNLAKYLGVSRQMVYNYLDSTTLDKWPKEKKAMLFKLLQVNTEEEIDCIVVDDDYLGSIENKLFSNKKTSVVKKDEVIELSGLKKDEQEVLNDIFFVMKEMLHGNKTSESLITLNYIYHFLQIMSSNKELKYLLAFVSKNFGFSKCNDFIYNADAQFVFESIMFSAFTLYNNGGYSKTKLAANHKRWENKLEEKNEEIMSRTQELNTIRVLALKELGYTTINEQNAREVFDKIAEIQARSTL
ncbi:MAG: hypothetical protein Q4G04_02295 [bacterium]|nr:hypothetical protein [bacterium]